MTFIRFLAPFEYTASDNRYVTIVYPAGWEGDVDDECALKAIAKGKAIEVEDEFAAIFAEPEDDEAEADDLGEDE